MDFKIKISFICFSLLTAGGCVNNIVPPPSSNAAPPSPSATVAPAGQQTPAAASSPSIPASGGQPAAPNATDNERQAQGTVDNQPVTIQVTELRRIAGDMVMLRMSVTNNGTGDINGGFFYQAVVRSYLLDAEQQKKYQIVSDANSKPLASAMNFDSFSPKSKREVFAQFPAPPPSTVRMSVYFGGSDPILNIPLAP